VSKKTNSFYGGEEYIKQLSSSELRKRLKESLCTVSMETLIKQELERRHGTHL
jgi:hypothetical protein